MIERDDCPDENEIVGFLEGALSGADRSALPSIWTCQGPNHRYVCDGRGFKVSEACPTSCLGEGFNHDDQCQ